MNETDEELILREFIIRINTGDAEGIVDLLHKHSGFDINCMNGELLALACMSNKYHIAVFLINNGADVHIQNELPIRFAALHHNFDLVKLLVSRGANIFAANNHVIRMLNALDKKFSEDGDDQLGLWGWSGSTWATTAAAINMNNRTWATSSGLGITSGGSITTIKDRSSLSAKDRVKKIKDYLNEQVLNTDPSTPGYAEFVGEQITNF